MPSFALGERAGDERPEKEFWFGRSGREVEGEAPVSAPPATLRRWSPEDICLTLDSICVTETEGQYNYSRSSTSQYWSRLV